MAKKQSFIRSFLHLVTNLKKEDPDNTKNQEIRTTSEKDKKNTKARVDINPKTS